MDVIQTADIQYNRGVTYYTLPGEDRQANLEKAISSYQEALQVFTKEAFPLNWAKTQHALGNAYRDLPGGNRQDNLQRAIACYKAALEVYTSKSAPADHATTQQDLAIASYMLQELKRGHVLPPDISSQSDLPLSLPRPTWEKVLITVLIVACVVLSGAAGIVYFVRSTSSCVGGSLTIDSSTALQPILQAAASNYHNQCSSATITVVSIPSKVGLTNLQTGKVQISASDIFADPTQIGLDDHQFSAIVFALVINSKVTGVSNLTTQQIKGIYSGSITNWAAVGGNNLPLTLISRPPSSGTENAFAQYVLCATETFQGPPSLVTDSTDKLASTVKNTDGALGYITLVAAKQNGLTTLSIDGNAPTPALVKSNTYKFWSIGHIYTRGIAFGLTRSFINYLTSDAGKESAQNADADEISINDLSRNVRASHQPGATSC